MYFQTTSGSPIRTNPLRRISLHATTRRNTVLLPASLRAVTAARIGAAIAEMIVAQIAATTGNISVVAAEDVLAAAVAAGDMAGAAVSARAAVTFPHRSTPLPRAKIAPVTGAQIVAQTAATTVAAIAVVAVIRTAAATKIAVREGTLTFVVRTHRVLPLPRNLQRNRLYFPANHSPSIAHTKLPLLPRRSLSPSVSNHSRNGMNRSLVLRASPLL